MKLNEFSGLLGSAAAAGAGNAPAGSGEIPDTLTKAQAYRLYGRDVVDRWIREGLIHPVASRGSGRKRFLDRLKVEAVARSEGRSSRSLEAACG